MILQKVVLDNIRSHGHYEFIPAEHGITSISGENGTGKSTILNAFAWSLFGTKGLPMTVKEMIKEGVDPKKDYVGVSSYFSIGTRDYHVKRQIVGKTGTTSAWVYSKESKEDEWKEDAGSATSHAERFLRSVLGFNEKSFYSSSFVQQKQVDQIILSSPKDRTAIIEKLLGISTITSAISEVKTVSKELQNSLQVVQTADIDTIQKELDEVTAKKNERAALLTQLGEQYKKTNALLQEKKKELKEKETVFDTFTEESRKLELISQDIKNTDERIVEKVKEIDEAGDVAFSKETLKKICEKAKEEEEQVTSFTKKIAALSAEKSSLDKLYETKVDPASVRLYKSVLEEKEQTDKMIPSLQADILSLTDSIQKAKQFLTELKEGVAVCPFCGSAITDVEKEKKEHEGKLKEDEKRLAEAEQKLSEDKKKATDLLNESLRLKEETEVLKNQKKEKARYEKIVSDLSSLSMDKEVAETLLKKTREKLSLIQADKAKSEAVVKAKATVKFLSEQRKEKEEEKKAIEERLKELASPSKKELSQIKEEVEYLTNGVEQLIKDGYEKKADVAVGEEKEKTLTDQLERAKEAEEKYKDISKELTDTNSALSALTEFKQMRTENAIPDLSDIASDILEKFTEGKYKKVTFDGKFNISVTTEDGREREVNKLSGGELSSVAIAIRLAIAMFLNGGKSGLLILDEVLVSMDEEKQSRILNTMQEINGSQIILVAHSQIANTIADHVVML